MNTLKKKILIADDDAAILDALKIMLEDEEYEVEATVNGATTQHVEKSKPDLLLLDIWMAGMDGRVICKKLKSSVTTRHVPIVMISATKDVEQIAKDSGADDFISKPFQRENLLAIVSKYINKE